MVLPDMEPLKEWIKSESKLGNPTLQKYIETADSAFLDNVYAWSLKVNKDIAELVYGMPPFPLVRESLVKLTQKADSIVVSQTPVEALEREWVENGIDGFVRVIAGQEFGTKTEHLKYAAKGKYPDNKILMIGDAPGDFEAAKSNGVLFFPVNPGDEEKSWERFYNEALDKFFEGSYAGDYEKMLIHEFDAHLPTNPSW